MPNDMNTFSEPDLQILESGIRWIQEAGERFPNKLFSVLVGERGSIHSFLLLLGPTTFGKHLMQFLHSFSYEIRAHGRVVTPFKDLWPCYAGMNLMALDPVESRRVVEAFLVTFSELAEDGWSPALEHTWRKALKAILASCLRSAKNTLSTRKSESTFITI